MSKSKLYARLTTEGALFPVYRHSISGSVSIVDHEKTFRDLGSGFTKILSYRLWKHTGTYRDKQYLENI